MSPTHTHSGLVLLSWILQLLQDLHSYSEDLELGSSGEIEHVTLVWLPLVGYLLLSGYLLVTSLYMIFRSSIHLPEKFVFLSIPSVSRVAKSLAMVEQGSVK